MVMLRQFLNKVISFYQAFLTQRFPFNRFRCSFHQTETCSNYARRLLRSDLPLVKVFRMINKRLRRCEESSIYMVDTGYVWGPLYDKSIQQCERELSLARELDDTRQNILSANHLIQKYRCNNSVVRSRDLHCFIRLRNHKAFVRSISVKLGLRIGCAALVCLSLLAVSTAAAVIATMCAVVFMGRSAMNQWDRWSRYKQIEASTYYQVE